MKCSVLKATGVLFAALEAVVVDGMVLQRASPENSKLSALPSKKRFAVLLRGETFRYAYQDFDGQRHRRGCDEHAIDLQMNCTRSVIENIIEPLEQRGNLVDVYLTTPKALATRLPTLHKQGVDSQWVVCSLDGKLFGALKAGSNRVVHRQGFETTGQADTMLKALDIFNKEYDGVDKVAARFDYIMIVRNDMMWYQSFDKLRIDYERVNVLARCEKGAAKNVGGLDCVQDTFWMMPGSFYPAFNSSLGHDGCFSTGMGPAANGHGCQKTIRQSLANAGHKGAFGWLDTNRLRVHQPSAVANVMYAGDQ